jgi:Holliday junction resolvase
MRRYRSARRDDNEQLIVAALEAAGAAVQRLETPLPDLLVSYRDTLYLIEVKRVQDDRKRIHAGKGGSLEGLTPGQERWWAAWKGRRPIIVHDEAEALAAIGAA